jgi:hypothetical protein
MVPTESENCQIFAPFLKKSRYRGIKPCNLAAVEIAQKLHDLYYGSRPGPCRTLMAAEISGGFLGGYSWDFLARKTGSISKRRSGTGLVLGDNGRDTGTGPPRFREICRVTELFRYLPAFSSRQDFLSA